MKRLILAIIILACSSCNTHHYKWKIEGSISHRDTLFPAIWFTDTFVQYADSVIIPAGEHSSKYVVLKPFTIHENK